MKITYNNKLYMVFSEIKNMYAFKLANIQKLILYFSVLFLLLLKKKKGNSSLFSLNSVVVVVFYCIFFANLNFAIYFTHFGGYVIFVSFMVYCFWNEEQCEGDFI